GAGSACDDEAAIGCEGLDRLACEDGVWAFVETCELLCDDETGCVECSPGLGACDGDVAVRCSADGESLEEVQDCGKIGLACSAGACGGAAPGTCAEAELSRSNIGCDYWAVDLDNAENQFDTAAAGQFAVVVANIDPVATVHVEVRINEAPQGEPLELSLVEETDIGPTNLYIFRLPRRDVDGINVTDGVDDGPQTWLSSRAFRVTSDLPVVAYQFNPLDQRYSNDTSLLLPSSGLGQDYLVLGYPPSGPFGQIGPLAGPKNRGYVTVVAAVESTHVEVVPAFDIEAGEGIDAIEAGATASFDIGPYDVVNLETRLLSFGESMLPDLTGSTVVSDKPVAVFFGTDLSVIATDPYDENACCAEHLEEQVIPSTAMGQKFVVSHSAQRNQGAPEADYYRIQAYEGGSVTTSLPAPNASFTLGAGGFHELYATTGFTIESDAHLHVAQFLVVGTDIASPRAGAGDNSLLYVPAIDQRRGLYVFTTGEGFDGNYAVVSMPEGGAATIDGFDVGSNCEGPRDDGALDGVSYESFTCEISDGGHVVHSGGSVKEAKAPIGVFVYGYYAAGSYAYAAGSELRQIHDVGPK
ncbi:MAG: IgGFc-binding protein, partial [Myxococcota bacterium]